MKRELVKEKIERVFYECDRHLLRIGEAVEDLVAFMPLDEVTYISLDKNQVQALDQFLFRFSKLQDTMGQKLFKTILLFLGEDIEGKPFIDILNLMEKLHLLDSANEWKELRDDRNDLAHNYEDEPIIASEIINRLYYKKDILIGIYQTIKEYYIKYV